MKSNHTHKTIITLSFVTVLLFSCQKSDHIISPDVDGQNGTPFLTMKTSNNLKLFKYIGNRTDADYLERISKLKFQKNLSFTYTSQNNSTVPSIRLFHSYDSSGNVSYRDYGEFKVNEIVINKLHYPNVKVKYYNKLFSSLPYNQFYQIQFKGSTEIQDQTKEVFLPAPRTFEADLINGNLVLKTTSVFKKNQFEIFISATNPETHVVGQHRMDIELTDDATEIIVDKSDLDFIMAEYPGLKLFVFGCESEKIDDFQNTLKESGVNETVPITISSTKSFYFTY